LKSKPKVFKVYVELKDIGDTGSIEFDNFIESSQTKKAIALFFVSIPTACCCVLLYFSLIVFGEFVPNLVTRIIAKFIPKKVENMFQIFFKCLCEKLSVMFPTTGKPPKECSAPNCVGSSEPATATTSFIDLDFKPHAPEVEEVISRRVIPEVVKKYELPAFLQTS